MSSVVFSLLMYFLPYKLQVAAYDTVEKKMAFFEPSRAKDFLFISGTKVGAISHFLVPSETPQAPSIWKEILEQQCDLNS